MNQSQTAKSMTHGEAGLMLAKAAETAKTLKLGQGQAAAKY